MMDYRNNYNNENETNNENMMAAEQNSFNGKKPSSKNKKAAKLAKKIGAIALSAVLFGSGFRNRSRNSFCAGFRLGCLRFLCVCSLFSVACGK